MGALTKAKMADQLFEELGFNKREAKEIVEPVSYTHLTLPTMDSG